jgi:hypothetical protein
MFVKTYKNFLCGEECAFLNKVALSNIDKWFDDGWDTGGTRTKLRLTTRTAMKGKTGLFPPRVLEIAERVRKEAGIDKYPIIDDHGSDGVTILVTYNGGDAYEHNDPRSATGDFMYRCNVLTQAPEGGADLYVNRKKIDVSVGDLHCYFASELLHQVTKIEGNTPRIMWLFGAYIPKESASAYGLPKQYT